MAQTARIQIFGDIGGAALNGPIVRTADGLQSHVVTIPAAKTGTLTTRTSDTVGTLTMASGHGITTGAIIDIYWAAGRRYDVTAGVVAGDSVPFSLGAGNVLPAAATTITAQVQIAVDGNFDGSDVVLVGAICDQRSRIGFREAGVTELNVDLVANEPWHWSSGGTIANPLVATLVSDIRATQASSTASATLRVGALYDSTP